MSKSAFPDAKRVLVVYKKSTYQVLMRARKHQTLMQLVEAGDADALRVIQAHKDHVDTLQFAQDLCKRLAIKASFRYRCDAQSAEGCDLVMSLGGDDTLLWASHFVGSQVPVLAVNSAPGASVGYFCVADRHSLESQLQAALAGRLPELKLNRMQIMRDGEVMTQRVLNDVLFCHRVPAATSHYMIDNGHVEEKQTSSGIWIGPAAGSTAALRSAGGQVLPLDSQALQFVVREPYQPHGHSYTLVRRLIEAGGMVRIRSLMDAGQLFIDGSHRVAQVDIGSELVMRSSKEPLTILGLKA